jgi:prepilin-type N-terminal cleavage/methylation domain-containing protein
MAGAFRRIPKPCSMYRRYSPPRRGETGSDQILPVGSIPAAQPRIAGGAARRGFTLLELLVVVTIIGLLAAYVGPKYFSQLGKSEQGVAKAQVEAFARALDTYRLDVGHYPTTEEGLNALLTGRPMSPSGTGPICRKRCRSIPGAGLPLPLAGRRRRLRHHVLRQGRPARRHRRRRRRQQSMSLPRSKDAL